MVNHSFNSGDADRNDIKVGTMWLDIFLMWGTIKKS